MLLPAVRMNFFVLHLQKLNFSPAPVFATLCTAWRMPTSCLMLCVNELEQAWGLGLFPCASCAAVNVVFS